VRIFEEVLVRTSGCELDETMLVFEMLVAFLSIRVFDLFFFSGNVAKANHALIHPKR
jgi:hypothetical protein